MTADRDAIRRDRAMASLAQIVRIPKAANLDRIAQAKAEREARVAREVRRVLGEAGVPLRLVEALGDVQPTEAVQQMRAAVRDEVRQVLLLGRVGAGKSFAVVDSLGGMVAEMADTSGQIRGAGLAWVYAPDAVAEGRYSSRIADWQRVPLLVLDDLGAEALDSKGFAADLLERVIYHRHGNRLWLAITSNLDAGQIRERYGERIASRLVEDGRVLVCRGDDLRRTR